MGKRVATVPFNSRGSVSKSEAGARMDEARKRNASRDMRIDSSRAQDVGRKLSRAAAESNAKLKNPAVGVAGSRGVILPGVTVKGVETKVRRRGAK